MPIDYSTCNSEILKFYQKDYPSYTFVICETRRTAKRLLDEMVRCFMHDIDKVDRMRYIVSMDYEIYRFIVADEADIKLKGYRNPKIMYVYEFEKFLEKNKERKK